MTADFSDERLSAYLDDELTPAERDEVEALLASSAEHRQLVEELRALRQTMREIPRARLPDDFAARVLRRALSAADASGTDAAAVSHGSTSASLDAPVSTPVSLPVSNAPVAGETPFAPWHVDGAAGLAGGTVAGGTVAGGTVAGGTSATELALRQSLELRRWRRAFWAASTVAAGLAAVLVGGGLPLFEARPTAQFTGESASAPYSFGSAPSGVSSPATASGPASDDFIRPSSEAAMTYALPSDGSAADSPESNLEAAAPGATADRGMGGGGRGDEGFATNAPDGDSRFIQSSSRAGGASRPGIGAPGGPGGVAGRYSGTAGGLGGGAGMGLAEDREESQQDGAGADKPVRSAAAAKLAANFARGIAAKNGVPGAVGRGSSPVEPLETYFVRVVLPRESLDSAAFVASFQNNGVVLPQDEQGAELPWTDVRKLTRKPEARDGGALRWIADADSTAEALQKRQAQRPPAPGAADPAEQPTSDAKSSEEQLALRFKRLDRIAGDMAGDMAGDAESDVAAQAGEVERTRPAGRLYHVRAPLDRIQNVLAELESRRADVNWFVPPSADAGETASRNAETERSLAEKSEAVRSDLQGQLRWDAQHGESSAATGRESGVRAGAVVKAPKSAPAPAAPKPAADDRQVRSKLPEQSKELKQSAESGEKAKDARTAEQARGTAADVATAPQARRYRALSNRELRDMAEQELLDKELQLQQGQAPTGAAVGGAPRERRGVEDSPVAGRATGTSRPPEVERLLRSVVSSEPNRRGRAAETMEAETAVDSLPFADPARKSNLRHEKGAAEPVAPIAPASPAQSSQPPALKAEPSEVAPPAGEANKQRQVESRPRDGGRDRPTAAGGAPVADAKTPAPAVRPFPVPPGEKAPPVALAPTERGSDRKTLASRLADSAGEDRAVGLSDEIYVDVYLWIEAAEPAEGRGRAGYAAEVPAAKDAEPTEKTTAQPAVTPADGDE